MSDEFDCGPMQLPSDDCDHSPVGLPSEEHDCRASRSPHAPGSPHRVLAPSYSPAQHHPSPSCTIFDINALTWVVVHPKQTDALQFIKLLRTASLDDPVAKLDDFALSRLWNPPRT
ncbi:hypothetical protein PISMIDRAFT_15723 [Pisolithus microcarpus 441]|uniref:Uncharacterized protein n=1 Tax=Pisolithus microcarpus 441 TaxID=765257 RepID=A0A0C9Z2J8_9AGAM|nr:hypothetical protein PISMIDRAFT_15723 [Pisolithus microcarpus 441]